MGPKARAALTARIEAIDRKLERMRAELNSRPTPEIEDEASAVLRKRIAHEETLRATLAQRRRMLPPR